MLTGSGGGIKRNKEQGTRNKEQGTRNKEQGTRNKWQNKQPCLSPPHNRTIRIKKYSHIYPAKEDPSYIKSVLLGIRLSP
ncbi:hypothetical protein AW064_21675 [Escherichia coli]|nr:hypothetical protein [Escherichia coli]OTB72532.1 hypothetical protein AW064_21675 [Escherichia coli]TJE71374.1 hypothetical protein C9209_18455 [Escherichia coli]TJP69731.1 hypothetical protein C9Z77_20465 [Escherichia coli]